MKNMIANPGKETARRLNRTEYGRLLNEAQPTVPKDLKAYRRLRAAVSALIDKGASRTPEETALLELTAALVSQYEEHRYAREEKPKPHEILRYLIHKAGFNCLTCYEAWRCKTERTRVWHAGRGPGRIPIRYFMIEFRYDCHCARTDGI